MKGWCQSEWTLATYSSHFRDSPDRGIHLKTDDEGDEDEDDNDEDDDD